MDGLCDNPQGRDHGVLWFLRHGRLRGSPLEVTPSHSLRACLSHLEPYDTTSRIVRPQAGLTLDVTVGAIGV
jgi:hypothetical protein